jgi:hypothetical protein
MQTIPILGHFAAPNPSPPPMQNVTIPTINTVQAGEFAGKTAENRTKIEVRLAAKVVNSAKVVLG